MRPIIIGCGEVGSALANVFERAGMKPGRVDPARGLHVTMEPREKCALHICFPHMAGFMDAVEDYRASFRPERVVIHSTVPLGTSSACGAFHSPIRGVHPKLEEGIRTFAKYLGPPDDELAAHFRQAGIMTRCVESAETCEALKLWDTTYYGLAIAFEKHLHGWCAAHGVDFDSVYRHANQTYNEGYAALGRHDVQRPVLAHKPGKIGGHCVIPNLALLGDNDPVAQFINEINERA